MSRFWADWQNDGSWGPETAYVNWWHVAPPPEFSKDPEVERALDPRFTLLKSSFRGGIQAFLAGGGGRPSDKPRPGAPGQDESVIDVIGDDFGEAVPMPGNVWNSGFQDYMKQTKDDWLPKPADLPTVSPDTVIVGVVDSGVAFGNTRFRDRQGKTRVLAAWQQGAPRPADGAQPYLPFGAELYRDDIDRLITQHSADGRFLGEDFNRSAGLIDMTNPLGMRVVARRTAHGTMVMDLAAGADPQLSDDRLKMLVVNLPNLATLNSSGIFLDYFTVYGIQRIIDLADAIYEKSRASSPQLPAGKTWPKGGFPVVINLSFGKNAGAKDGHDWFNATITGINTARVAEGKPPIQLVLPVGNHNLERGNAQFDLAAGGQDDISFRTLPDDQTSNYVEIWSDYLPLPTGAASKRPPVLLDIAITPPGGVEEAFVTGVDRQFMPGRNDRARVYCEVRRLPGAKTYRICYLLCTAPTIVHSGQNRPVTQAGPWRIRVRNRAQTPLRVFVSVQTDQATRSHSRTGLTPYLERPEYRRYDVTTGRILDSCDDPALFTNGKPDNQSVLRRHGSINATAMSANVVAVAGFRRSDGRPSDYSATGHGFAISPDGRSEPTFALPTDDSPALFGILAAGAADGSVVAMRGTSFASASATRLVAGWLKGGAAPVTGVPGLLVAAATAAEQALPRPAPACPTKVGRGRLTPTPHGRVNRTGGKP